jgi:hypothetical protein
VNYGLRTLEGCDVDDCIFRLEGKDNDIDVDMALHVDDLLTSGINKKSGDRIFQILLKAYGEVNETTLTEIYLGIKWLRDSHGDYKIYQPGYLKKILHNLNMENCERES